MNAEKVVLGLDVGVGSIGWGLVRIKEEEYPDEKPDGTIETKHRIVDGGIIASGVRTFQIPQDRQKKSLALQRGNARRSRRTTRRKARRLKRLIRLAKEFDLIGDGFNRDEVLKPSKGINKKEKWDIWFIRQQALKRKLEDIELFRILYHIAKHRGWYFHTKAEEMQKGDAKSEEGKAKAGLARIEKLLEESDWETIGQMFWETLKQTDKNKDKRRKRNAKDKYENSIKRLLLKKEIQEIFKRQRELGNDKVKEELEERYIEDLLMKEEGIDDAKLQKMMSRCEFVEGKLCAPKESYTAERFTLFNRLNTLELKDTKKKNGRLSLDKEQRGKIEALAYKNAKVTFAQIRKELGLGGDLGKRFNLCSYKEKDPEYKGKVNCEIKNGEPEFDEKYSKIADIGTGELRAAYGEIKGLFRKRMKKWPNAKSLYVYYSDIRKELEIGDEFRFVQLEGKYTKSAAELGSEGEYLKQFEKDATFVELKGYHKIKGAIEKHCGKEKWREIAADTDMLERIAEALVYHKSDQTRKEYLKENGIVDEDIIRLVQ